MGIRDWAAVTLAATLLAGSARAEAVGERHLIAQQPTAALRDAGHSPQLRVTVWYPAPETAEEQSLDIGPRDRPLFLVGSAAPNAAFVDSRRRPVILFSHGYGGSARMMGWFTTNLARAGFIVVAVDHPGNNSADKMTAPGAVMFWDRPKDLRAALAAAKADPDLAAHMDLRRVGVAGYATGGFAALAAGGAQVDFERFVTFCRSHPADGICAPQKEFPLAFEDGLKALEPPDLAAELAHARDDHTIPEVRAVFAIAPAAAQAFTPDSLARLRLPVAILVGDSDAVIPAHTNGGFVARAIPGVEFKVLPEVGHYDFLSACTAAAAETISLCQDLRTPQGATHEAALKMAFAFFSRALGPP